MKHHPSMTLQSCDVWCIDLKPQGKKMKSQMWDDSVCLLVVDLLTLCLCPDLKSPLEPPFALLTPLIKLKSAIGSVWGGRGGGKAPGTNDQNVKNPGYFSSAMIIKMPRLSSHSGLFLTPHCFISSHMTL